jgi:hypothetical protein
MPHELRASIAMKASGGPWIMRSKVPHCPQWPGQTAEPVAFTEGSDVAGGHTRNLVWWRKKPETRC